MNTFKKWLLENRLAAATAVVFVVLAGLLGWLTLGAWDNYASASLRLSSSAGDLQKLEKQNPAPTQANVDLITKNLTAEQAGLNSLLSTLRASRIVPFAGLEKTKTQDRPQVFQDALRNEVTAIRTLAGGAGSTLPSGFYLGLSEYENRLPSPNEVLGLASQLTVFDWIAKKLTAHQGVIIGEFERALPSALPGTTPKPILKNAPKSVAETSKTAPNWSSPGSLKLSFRCDQSTLRDFVNSLSSSPYFLIIDSLQLQNSVPEPPRRDSVGQPQQQPVNPTPGTDGQQSQRLPIIVGREQLNVSMRLKIIEFPSDQAAPSAPTAK
jgi:hypothetical protein